MTAFQEGFPDLTVFVTFGHSLVWKQSDGGKKPLADCPDGLLVPFLDGMIEAADGKDPARRRPRDVVWIPRVRRSSSQAREAIKVKAAGLAADPLKYQSRRLRRLWPLARLRPAQVTAGRPTRSRATISPPSVSSRACERPSNNADEYVWIYTEKPRWWSKSGKPVDLPLAYVDGGCRKRWAELVPQGLYMRLVCESLDQPLPLR